MLNLWEVLEKKLNEIAADRHHEDHATVRTVIGVILSAGQEKDILYLHSDQFYYHCHVAGLSPEWVARMIERAWYVIDNNIKLDYKGLDKEEGE